MRLGGTDIMGIFGPPSPPACVTVPFSSLREYEMQSFGPLLIPAAIVFVLATLARLVTFALFLKPFAEAACPTDSKLARKFREAAWRSILYAVACGWAIKVMFYGPEELPWMQDSELFWKGWPNHEVTAEMSSIYALYLGLYVHQVVYLFLDTKTSDFPALLAHHFITMSIVVGSWSVSFTRIGAFTMALHDVSDIFLELAKCFNYSKIAHPKFGIGSDVAFVVFAISFFALRLGVYPKHVVYSAMFEACPHVSCIEPPTLANCAPTVTFGLFIPLLLGLQLLQLFWGWKVLGVISTVLRGKELEDPRDE